MAVLKYLHLLALALWLGGIVFFSFIATPSIFKMLDGQTAGAVVGDLFPKYFLMGYVLSTFLLGSLLFIGQNRIAGLKTPLALIAAATLLAFAGGLGAGSKARDLKVKMYAEQDPVKKEEIHKEFRKAHALSSSINVAVLALLLAYAWYLPDVLRPGLAERAKSLFG